MRIELRNIGPINKAGIDLDGFALLVGPNASGKTTLSTVAYAALLSHNVAQELTNSFALNRLVHARQRDAAVDVEALAERFAATFRDALTKELRRCFSPDLSKLPRRGRTGNGSAPRIIVSDRPSDDDPWKLVFRIREGALVLEPRHVDFKLPSFRGLRSEEATDPTVWLRRARSHTRSAVVPVYFPAARSGYVQMQSVIASLLIGALGRGYFGEISIGKISGVAADFLQFLAGIDPTDEATVPAEVARRLEEDLIHGRLRLRASTESAKVIEFAPLHLDEYWTMDSAATSIAEIAPLLLYLRHSARQHDLLFIDEPEAHLHPRNQLVLASVLLELSTFIQGMVVGTHSDYFATGMSNGLLRASLAGGPGYHVRVYALCEAAATGGYEAVPAEVDPRTGFSVDQFADVAESALDEAEDLFVRATHDEV